MNYYNEHDPKAAAWLRELMRGGHIPEGVVDERSIRDVRADDLVGFTQCHFFAGIGGWALAFRLAGWPEGQEVWTGSCPCQPFSCAGKGGGTDDERHLWPDFARLIRERRPATVFGEQVASAAGRDWLAGVFADLERMGYRGAGSDLPAAGIGAPHIRQRLFWVGDTGRAGSGRHAGAVLGAQGQGPGERGDAGREPHQSVHAGPYRDAGHRLDHPLGTGLEGHAGHGRHGHEPGRLAAQPAGPVAPASGLGVAADPASGHRTAWLDSAIVPPLAAEFIAAYREARG